MFNFIKSSSTKFRGILIAAVAVSVYSGAGVFATCGLILLVLAAWHVGYTEGMERLLQMQSESRRRGI